MENQQDRSKGLLEPTLGVIGTRRTVTYFVNGERQTTESDDLSVRQILEGAGFKPADQYQLIRDSPHHVFTALDETIELHQEERFTAIFQGPTPTS